MILYELYIKIFRDQKQIHSPYLQVYPDLGNLSAWPENDPARELEKESTVLRPFI